MTRSDVATACPIELLNAEVQRKVKHALLNPSKDAADHRVAFEAVSKGAQVYQSRNKLLVASYCLLALAGLVMTPSLSFLLACLSIMFVVVDFYGAVLHVVLDNPNFVSYPLIGPGCLEFQWHHLMQHDIVSKPFVEVCGDLNVLMFAHLLINFLIYGADNRAANCSAACFCVMAYLGQWAHRQAHAPASSRSGVTVWAQSAGLLVNPKLHKTHHTNYDDGFPILNGLSSSTVKWLNARIPDQHVWLVVFLAMSIALISSVNTVAASIVGV